MKKLWLVAALLLAAGAGVAGPEAPVSQETQLCLECHEVLHPGIVEDWRESRHAQVTPGAATAVKGLSRKVSSEEIPEFLRDRVVGCAECHTMRSGEHPGTVDHSGAGVHVVVSPRDCATCHSVEVAQFGRNLMSHAHGNLVNNGVYQFLIDTINAEPGAEAGRDADTEAESCLYCHGTRLAVTGKEERETDFGVMTFPVIEGWPNQGTGRINPDGSRGACTACHTRHRFSIEMARKPFTCKECHVGPDVPAYKVYAASKHGNIFSTHNREWDFEAVPWEIGEDFTAPTCAACHISLLVGKDEALVAERTHEVKNRLPYRIFGLIYAHPHPREADTSIIRNADGLQLPTAFDGGTAAEYLLDPAQQEEHKERMQRICLNCHDASWVDGHWRRFENTIRTTNAATGAATGVMAEIWANGHAEGLERGRNPFDEFIERIWSEGWLFYANSVRFSSAMAGGGDYGVFADGRYQLTANLQELLDWYELRRGTGAPPGDRKEP